MKPFCTIAGQDHAKSVLCAAVETNRLAHAYILAGPTGSGRLTAALDLAKVHICREVEGGFCGTCTHCLQIDGFTHPDVRLTIPALKTTGPGDIVDLLRTRAQNRTTPVRFQGNTYISIDQIRELEQRLTKRSFEGRGYVEIILGAHLMRREAANAMLKTLEEPPGGTLLILITSALSRLLPTVRSRAHTVRFGRLGRNAVEEVLVGRGIPAEKAARLAWHADGCPGRAFELSDTLLEEHTEAVTIFNMLFSGEKGTMELASLAADKARSLGREGLMDLCTEMISLAHDARRKVQGCEPLSREFLPELKRADDDMLRNLLELLHLCRTRIIANVSPAMAFAGALAAASEKVCKT